MIQDESIAVNAYRYPAVLVRVLPLLLVKMGASLKLILVSLSVSYALFHIGIYLLIRYYLKLVKLSWLQLAYMIVPVAHSFFWNNSELNLGLSVLILFLAALRAKNKIMSCLIATILPWFHPLLLLPFGFICLHEWFNGDPNKKNITQSALLFFLSQLVKTLFFRNWYDDQKGRTFSKNLLNYDFGSQQIFSSFFDGPYWALALVCLLAVITLVLCRKWFSVVLFLLFFLDYLFIHDVSTTLYELHFYHEVTFLTLFVVAAYLIEACIPKIDTKVFVILVCLITIGFFRIISQAKFYTDRVDKISKLAIDLDLSILKYDPVAYPEIILPWATPYESLLISTLNGESKTFIMTDDLASFTEKERIDDFLRHDAKPLKSPLNKDYFDLSPVETLK